MVVKLFITVGGIAIVGAVTEKILNYCGQYDIADGVSNITKGAMGITVLIIGMKIIKELGSMF